MIQDLPIDSQQPSSPSSSANLKNRILVLLVLVLLLASAIAGFLLLRQSQKPIVTVKPSPQSISSLPPISSAEDAQKRLEMIASRLTDPSAAQKYQEALREAAIYTDPNHSPAIVEVARGGKYGQVFGDLKGQYYATRDPEVLALAQQLRAFIKEKYPVLYNGSSPEAWEIKGE